MATDGSRTVVLADGSETEVDSVEESDGPATEGTCGALKEMFKKPIACLLVAVPIAWVLAFVAKRGGGIEHGAIQPVWHFAANFFAIIPLSWVISECTEQLEKKVGPMLGALLNSTFGNVVEMILSTTAILRNKFKLVQAALLGAMLMNTLGVLGLVFMTAGLNHHVKKFNVFQATYNLALLALATLGLSVPTGLAVFDDWSTASGRLQLSRCVAIFLFLMYCQWIVFNLCTHAGLFDKRKKGSKHWFWATTPDDPDQSSQGQDNRALYTTMVDETKKDLSDDDDDDDDDGPEMSSICAIGMLLCATVIVSFHCDWLVEAINPVCQDFHVKEAFMATVLIPMVGNFSEVIAAVSIACKGKLDLAMGVAIGSATQIALCVIPVACFIAWIFNKPLDLDFETFQVKTMYLAIMVTALLLIDGQANWLKGSMLVTTYVLVTVAFWWLSDNEFESAGEAPELVALNRSSLANNHSLVKED